MDVIIYLSESCPKLIVKIKFGVNQASSEIPKQSIGMGLKNYGSNRVRRKNLRFFRRTRFFASANIPCLRFGLFINKIKLMFSVQSYCQDFEGNHCASSHCPFHTPMEKNRNESIINNSRHREPRAHRSPYSQAAELRLPFMRALVLSANRLCFS